MSPETSADDVLRMINNNSWSVELFRKAERRIYAQLSAGLIVAQWVLTSTGMLAHHFTHFDIRAAMFFIVLPWCFNIGQVFWLVRLDNSRIGMVATHPEVKSKVIDLAAKNLDSTNALFKVVFTQLGSTILILFSSIHLGAYFPYLIWSTVLASACLIGYFALTLDMRSVLYGMQTLIEVLEEKRLAGSP